MDLLIFRYDEWLQLYNCTFYVVESLSSEQREHRVAGVMLMAMVAVFEAIYIPCLCVITRKEYIRLSCFKLMSVIGFLDVFLMPLSGFLTGFFAVHGAMYCSYPRLIYAVGTIVTALWGGHMLTSMILAINRCMLIAKPLLAERLFAGSRTLAWLLIPFGISVAFLFFQPLMYNGVAFAYVVNPHLGYVDDNGTKYTNRLHMINNLIVSAGVPTVYVVFIIALCTKGGGMQSLAHHRELNSFVQVLCISIVTAIPSVLYVYFQFFPCPPLVAMLCTFGWICIHGAPPMIYLTMNRSIRRKIFRRGKALPNIAWSYPSVQRPVQYAVQPALFVQARTKRPSTAVEKY